MFGYYLDLAWRSMKRSPVLTALMVVAIGLGIGASMTMLTVLHVMSGDPIPNLSSKLFVPMLNPLPVGPMHSNVRGTPDGFTWTDAMNLIRDRHADGAAAMASGSLAVMPKQPGLHPFRASGQFVTADFFRMFDVPFRVGTGWTAEQGRGRARVVVLNAKLDRRLFGSDSGIGQIIRLDNTDFRVVGVVNAWNPQPRFYVQKGDSLFDHAAAFFIPLRTAMALQYGANGHTSCWNVDSSNAMQGPNCTWLQFWVRLDSPAKVTAYRRLLDNYWRTQQAHGRFPRKDSPPHLYNMMAWLAHEQVVPPNLSMQTWLAVGFLAVCMLSEVALLLAKFLRRKGEVSVRRALGAKRRDIFAQFGMESALIGVAGGLLGVVIAQLGLWSIRQRPEGYAHLAQMDVPMLLATVALAIGISVLAGLLPAWRACQVPPALYLKVQ